MNLLVGETEKFWCFLGLGRLTSDVPRMNSEIQFPLRDSPLTSEVLLSFTEGFSLHDWKDYYFQRKWSLKLKIAQGEKPPLVPVIHSSPQKVSNGIICPAFMGEETDPDWWLHPSPLEQGKGRSPRWTPGNHSYSLQDSMRSWFDREEDRTDWSSPESRKDIHGSVDSPRPKRQKS